MDQIRIEQLEVFARCGVAKEEHVLAQKFLISVCLETDVRRAGKTDDLHDSLDYKEISYFIKTFLEKQTYQLIETMAEQLGRQLLLHYNEVQQITLEIQKPWAPIGLSLKTVSVRICRRWHIAYIGLGSNMGDRKKQLDDAVSALEKEEDCNVICCSSYWNTKPYGGVKQDDFLNATLELRTLLTPEELLERLHKIEQLAKRERTVHWGPRTLDLDILFYDQLILDTKQLHIPHLDLQNRLFVLQPLQEIAPHWRHPILQKTVAQLAEECAKQNGGGEPI